MIIFIVFWRMKSGVPMGAPQVIMPFFLMRITFTSNRDPSNRYHNRSPHFLRSVAVDSEYVMVQVGRNASDMIMKAGINEDSEDVR